MQLTRKIALFLLCGMLAQGAFAQELFQTGMPLEPDPNYDKIPVKAQLTNDNYRDIGSSASVKQYAPIPQSQGQYGTCVAWACAYAARTIVEAKRYGWTDKAEIGQNIFSYGFIYRVAASSPNCWGAFPSDCLSKMKEIGIPKFSDYRVHCPQGMPPQSAYDAAAQYKIRDYVRLWDETTINVDKKKRIEAAKKSLSEGNPIVIAMICPSSFHYPKSEVWTPTESPNDNPNHPHGRHAMCVVGYDDDKHGGAFEIQNSWGSSWGTGGYIWVKYDDFADFVYQAFELVSFDEPKPNQDVSLSGSVRFVADNGQEMKATLGTDRIYKMDRPYRSGTRFRLFINNNEPAYVYAIGSDLSNKIDQIFPHMPNVSPLLTYKRNDVALPSENKHIRMNNVTGTDFLCVLYSKDPLNLDDLKKRISQQSNRLTFKEKVEAALGNRVMSANEVNYGAGGKISFNAKGKGKSVVALVVATEHIE